MSATHERKPASAARMGVGYRVTREGLLGALLCGATFCLALTLYTRHATLPYWWHPDEPGKVAQVTGDRALNFKHPLLLMNTTRALAWVTGADGDRQAAVRVGRFVSAVFGALTAVACVGLAWLQRGLFASACVALIVLLSCALFDFSHFMKEDTALAFGLSATLLAGSWFVRRPSRAAAAAFGVACALALSAKYVGAVALLGAVPILIARLRAAPRSGARRGLAFGAGFAVALLLVNVSVLRDFDAFLAGLGYETNHAVTGGGKPFPGILSMGYLTGLKSQVTTSVGRLAMGWVLYVVATWRRRTLDERAVALFPPLFLGVIWLSPIKAIRYLLPMVVVSHVLAGFAVAALAGAAVALLPRLRSAARMTAVAPALNSALAVRCAVASLLLFFVLGPEVREMRKHLHAFEHDSRFALYAWVRDHVPRESAILQDRYAGLPDPSRGFTTEALPALSPRLVTLKYAVDHGSVDEMRADGIEWVAVCGRIYERFLSKETRFGAKATRTTFEERGQRYAELFERGTLVFKAGDTGMAGVPVNPEIRVYRLP